MSASVLRVLVDDVRVFRDGREALVAQTSTEALALLRTLDGRFVDELWLDHDLVGDDTVQPLVDHLVARASAGAPLPVGRIYVHSANVRAGHRVNAELVAAGYPSRRSFVAGMWRHRWMA
ncbi:cyclic-phosphate processing receiver domain-containing protein [Arthrobacter sp. NEB 688]|uniref:cyclic-phosphate processing receiver domain-containing protein n=1 Tax=Arthrobacter sp. NEB 688 TaxID=904039 RepID=UPI0015655398|nr:cyclic-phosphate processing receiver domain-containing protein [Arthrobacter sp. NEB 688]QKE84406.1 hypothetical protein HL663_10975 [Arthrobacter sp. NEB 688]